MRRTIAGLAAAGLVTAVAAAGAHAQTIRIHDGRDTNAQQELVGVRVTYENMVSVAMRFSSNYFLHGEVPYTIWYDTNPKNPGPEYALYEHFGSVYKVKGWHGGLRHEVDCFVTGARNADKHVWRITVSDKCFGDDTGPIRVSVDALAKSSGSPSVIDYVPGKHQWSEPVVAALSHHGATSCISARGGAEPAGRCVRGAVSRGGPAGRRARSRARSAACRRTCRTTR